MCRSDDQVPGPAGQLMQRRIASITRSMPLPGPSRPHVRMVGLLGRFTGGSVGTIAPCGIVMTLRRSTP